MKIERKISFIVAGYEFDNLKTAQFFARYVDNARKNCEDQNKPELSAKIILQEMYRLVNADVVNTDEELVEVVMGLQMPKPPKKKKVPELKDPVAHAERVKAQREKLELDNPPGWNEEYYGSPVEDDTEFEMIPDNSMPGIYGKDDTIG